MTANFGVALGDNSVANRGNSVSVGSDTLKRQIANVAAGTEDTDAVNLAQLNEAIANVDGDSPYFRANGAGDGSDAANAVGAGSIAIGSNASTRTDGGVAIGNHAASTMQNGVAIGNTTAASENAVAVGYDAHAMTTGSIAVGAHDCLHECHVAGLQREVREQRRRAGRECRGGRGQLGRAR